MATSRSRRAEEILDAAMQLFAEQGYGATSVADIQEAAGMTPGSGALYKHFPSKQSLLEAGMDRFIAEGRDAALKVPAAEGADVRAVLRQLGGTVLKVLSLDQSALRVAWRDLYAFPELNQRFVDERLQLGFRQMTVWLTNLAAVGKVDIPDPPATAAVLLSSLAFFRVMEGLVGETPGGLGDSRFLDAWVEVAASALGPKPPPRRKQR